VLRVGRVGDVGGRLAEVGERLDAVLVDGLLGARHGVAVVERRRGEGGEAAALVVGLDLGELVLAGRRRAGRVLLEDRLVGGADVLGVHVDLAVADRLVGDLGAGEAGHVGAEALGGERLGVGLGHDEALREALVGDPNGHAVAGAARGGVIVVAARGDEQRDGGEQRCEQRHREPSSAWGQLRPPVRWSGCG
jgi:hypothetical protein